MSSLIICIIAAGTVTGLCTALFQLILNTEDGSIVSLIQNVVFVSGVVCELFVYCTFGEIASANLEAIADAIYTESNWYNHSPQMRRQLLMIMRAAQKPQQLSWLGLQAVSCRMGTFSSVGTFFSLLPLN